MKDVYQMNYFSSDNFGLLYPTKKQSGNLSDVIKMVKLEKKGDSDQHGYVIANLVVKDTYLQVTEEILGSKKRSVRFTTPKHIEDCEFYQSQLFKRHHHPSSGMKFALYVSATDSKGHNKFYYLKPKSGAIVAEKSSSPDGYYYFSMSRADRKYSYIEEEEELTHYHALPLFDTGVKKDGWIVYGKPLTVAQIERSDVSKKDYLFGIGSSSLQFTYLDTANLTMRYQHLPEKVNLSVLMKIKKSEKSNKEYLLSTDVCPQNYLTIIKNQSGKDAQQVQYLTYPDKDKIPTWTMRAHPTKKKMIGMVSKLDGEEYYLHTATDKLIVAQKHPSYTFEVFPVISISWIRINPQISMQIQEIELNL